jgi:hypothetical protein
LCGLASVGLPSKVDFSIPDFCTGVHSFPQLSFQISLAKKKRRVYRAVQIEPGSLKNLTAQLKEGAAAARLLRLRFFVFISIGAFQPGPVSLVLL